MLLPFPSIYDLPPLETGGVVARAGFLFQDHVALGFCLAMVQEGTLREVWCESQDDITLLWEQPGGLAVEFVQVKTTDGETLWTISELCERKKTKDLRTRKTDSVPGTSILEKSLKNDRCCEPTAFRLVTTRRVKSELQPLTLPRDSPDRQAQLGKLGTHIRSRIGDVVSDKNHDCMFWVEHVLWEVRHDTTAVKHSNLSRLRGLLDRWGLWLSEAQLAEDLYTTLLHHVQTAAQADARVNRAAKRIERNAFAAWLQAQVSNLHTPPATVGGQKLQTKMIAAALAPDIIESANDQRRFYLTQCLNPKYFDASDRQLIEQEVIATLQRLRSRLDSAKVPNSGPDFHNACLEELQHLQHSLAIQPPPPLSFLYGCMYAITDRCRHRFQRL